MHDLDSNDSSLILAQNVALSRASLGLERVRREVLERDELKKRDSTSCRVCSALLSSLSQAFASRTETSLGTWESLLKDNACRNHETIFPPRESLNNQAVLLRKPANKRLIYVQPDAYRRDAFTAFDAPWEGLRIREESMTSGIRSPGPRPRIINREWINLDLPKTWLQNCLEYHHETCGMSEIEFSAVSHNLILVDTIQGCLVQHNSSCRYLALSYVWGSVNDFLTTTSSFWEFCKPGALDETSLGASGRRLPRTIDHAIQLTRALGERYLWVDSLCIVQDGADKIDHLNSMASIYANAILTIIAAQGANADAGIGGLRNISEPRDARQYIAPLSPDRHLIRPTSKHVWDDTLLQPWSTRAWTFQESIFSRRALQFAHGSVRWYCRKARWSEESESPDCLQAYSSLEQRQLTLSSPQLSKSALPMLEEYEALVNGFNVRKLTYPEDALSAFAGVSARLGTKFSGGLLSGLPELFFDVCLLWRPTRRLGPARRRQASSVLTDYTLPSWSWAGWETEVSWPYTWNRQKDPAGPIAILFGNFRPFYQVVFHTMAENGEPLPVENSWLRDARVAMDEQLPEGWSSHNVSDSELQEYGIAEPVLFFRHNAEPSAEFCFPVPYDPIPLPPRTSTTLHFETTSGHFKLGETRRSMTRIHTLDGSPAGTLWQHDEGDSDLLSATSGPLESRRHIELVAILGCTIPRDDLMIWEPPDMSISMPENHRSTPSRTEDVYNVMWILREGEISCRKATGVIGRSVWESNASYRVSINLE